MDFIMNMIKSVGQSDTAASHRISVIGVRG